MTAQQQQQLCCARHTSGELPRACLVQMLRAWLRHAQQRARATAQLQPRSAAYWSGQAHAYAETLGAVDGLAAVAECDPFVP